MFGVKTISSTHGSAGPPVWCAPAVHSAIFLRDSFSDLHHFQALVSGIILFGMILKKNTYIFFWRIFSKIGSFLKIGQKLTILQGG